MAKVVSLKIVKCPVCGSKITSFKNVDNRFCRKCRNIITVYNLDEYTDQEITEIYDMFEKTRIVLEENNLHIDETELIELTISVFDKERDVKNGRI